MTEIRNELVHPKPKYQGKINSRAFNETQNLYLWFIELSLLKLCDYSWTYYNRFTNQVEDVPWKK